MNNPLGYSMKKPVASWKIIESNGKKAKEQIITVSKNTEMTEIVCKVSGKAAHSTGTELPITLEESTRYYWNVYVITEAGETAISDVAWFETAKNETEWKAYWITPEIQECEVLYKKIYIGKEVKKARLSMSAVGLYEAYLDGQKIGDEYLTPNFNDYDSWIQFQTYEMDGELDKGEHLLEIKLGDGWYKGRYLTFSNGTPNHKYGEHLAAIAELNIEFEDGTKEIVITDETWNSRQSKIRENSIYDGELIDDTHDISVEYAVKKIDIGTKRLKARLSLPVKKMMVLKPQSVIHTPKNETVLDFGQNMAGWFVFYNRLGKGEKCVLTGGEILQNDSFYHGNMRSAKTRFTYVSDGVKKWIRPHFTYYGFRYVKLEGFGENINLHDFEAWVLYSEMEQTGTMKTGHEKVNQLISNILWGQRSNFIDVPTDCPQRDERLGWTGDTQIFCETASFNMDTQQFYRKHMFDVWCEQQKNKGMVPMVVPDLFMTAGSAAWGDVATIVPWEQYLMYGDQELLEGQYPSMKAWVDYILEMDNQSGATRLWKSGTHFGDWVSLDAADGQDTGGTDVHYIATVYYYYSAVLVSKAAGILGRVEEEEKYTQLQKEIKEAFQKEYFTPAGRLVYHTQTAYILPLYFDLCPEGAISQTVEGLIKKLRDNQEHLTTGFVGTPYLCPVLSKYGYHDKAYGLLLNEEFPGWLYAVNMGATTVWERWNSVLPDGTMHPDGMNSLNHYAYGSIQGWMYKDMMGIRQKENSTAWKSIVLCPNPDQRLGFAEATFESPMGRIVSAWKYDGNEILFMFEVPFDTEAEIILPDGRREVVTTGAYQYKVKAQHPKCEWNADMKLEVLLADEACAALLEEYVPEIIHHKDDYYQGQTLREAIGFVFNIYTYLDLAKVEEKLYELSKN